MRAILAIDEAFGYKADDPEDKIDFLNYLPEPMRVELRNNLLKNINTFDDPERASQFLAAW